MVFLAAKPVQRPSGAQHQNNELPENPIVQDLLLPDLQT
jgi:hypothetical protein